MTVFTPRSQQSKEKTAKICDYLSFLTMRLDRVAQVLSPTSSLCRARSLVCYSAGVHAELNAMFHSDQTRRFITNPRFSFVFSQLLAKSRVFVMYIKGLFSPASRVEQAHFSPLTTYLTTCGDFFLNFGNFSIVLRR